MEFVVVSVYFDTINRWNDVRKSICHCVPLTIRVSGWSLAWRIKNADEPNATQIKITLNIGKQNRD